MAEISNKIEYLECENKLLVAQQNNYKELCKVLTDRHVEILKYLNNLKSFVEKGTSISKDSTFATYINKSQHENAIIKYDKQIQALTDSIQSSQAKISDNEENLFKEQMKILSTSIDESNSNSNNISIIHNYSKYRCEFFDCTEEFNSKLDLENHLQSQHNFNNSLESGHFVNYEKKDVSETKINDVLFVPQMKLEVLEYNSNNSTTDKAFAPVNSMDKTNGYKKLASCDFCGKYFNKHYLESHKRSHTGYKPFKCSVVGCNRAFTQSSSRNFHEKRFHQNTKYVFKCSYINCDSSFDRMEELQKHLQQHQALINTVTHTIDISGIDSPLSDSVPRVTSGRGKSSNRPENAKHVCVHCGKSFEYKISLKQHALMHGNKNFRCPVENCNYSSYWKHNLGLHLRKHHSNQNQPLGEMST